MKAKPVLQIFSSDSSSYCPDTKLLAGYQAANRSDPDIRPPDYHAG